MAWTSLGRSPSVVICITFLALFYKAKLPGKRETVAAFVKTRTGFSKAFPRSHEGGYGRILLPED
jgi:hypothetical protein